MSSGYEANSFLYYHKCLFDYTVLFLRLGEMFNNEYEESKWDNLTQGDEGKEINGSGKMPQGTPVLRVWREEMGKIDVES